MFRKILATIALLLCVSPTWAATLYVEEFTQPLATYYQAATMPGLVHQTVAITGASVQSAAFNVGTVLIRVETDAICSIEISLNPTAATTTMRMAAGQTEYFVVPAGAAFKIAVIANT